MIGNDIIDLELARKESNWRRKGYLNKLFTLEEQELINQSATPDLIVWSLWSMKEAVYKADFRRTLQYEYAPLNVSCISMQVDNEGFKSEVLYNEIKYFTFTKVISGFLHTIACRWKDDFVRLNIIEVIDYPKDYLFYLKNNNLISKSANIIKNEHGVPNLINLETNNMYPLSISHHGSYLGVAVAPFYTI